MEASQTIRRLKIVDSHTAGEPTRVVVGGAPLLEGKTMEEKRASFERIGDWVRTACICEPRGFEAIVGAILCESEREDCVAGIVFFNNSGTLNGCVHGTIGLTVTLGYLGRIGAGTHGIETPSGVVTVRLGKDGVVTVRNVQSFRHASGVEIVVPGYGPVRGDVAWGGNWFFLVDAGSRVSVDRGNLDELTRFTKGVRRALGNNGVTGKNGGEIDHIEVFAPPRDPSVADSRNFVLCPGNAYDRSPCGTGTSAKLACLHADGKLSPGQTWRQAGILETVFEGMIEPAASGEGVFPIITGSAFITGEAELLCDPADPFAHGIPQNF